jgi:hypothetical protein
MNKFAANCCAAVALWLLCGAPQQAAAQTPASISYQAFYDELAPYGQWINDPQYGYVWQPETGGGFRPYCTNGKWVWTNEYGWTWVSLYSWGWAPFHYGRWINDEAYGWLWVPGTEWSPAWVVWRSGGDYYGWAPLAPETNINLSLDQYSPSAVYWCFVQRSNVTSPYLGTYCIGPQRNAALVNATTIINNRRRTGNVFSTGPRTNEVENYTHLVVKPATIHELSRPGRWEHRNNDLTMYKPEVSGDNNRRNAPGRSIKYKGSRTTDLATAGKIRKTEEPVIRREEVIADNKIESNAAPKSRGWQSATSLYNGKTRIPQAQEQKEEKEKYADPGPEAEARPPSSGENRGWQSASSLYNRKVREVRRRSDYQKKTSH